MYLLCVCGGGGAFFFFFHCLVLAVKAKCKSAFLHSRKKLAYVLIYIYAASLSSTLHKKAATSVNERYTIIYPTSALQIVFSPLPVSPLKRRQRVLYSVHVSFSFFFFSNRFRLCKGEKKKDRAYILHTSCS